ncbi:PRC-barrel domain containing protein [Streptomyces sp. NBC_01477]|uniref:PRC-barrel domain containing protein n=1 Tax=Streptomyces sp. NBC_01477 TaxID=2976015 RepID=UPI002E319D31|nr:PRC-barrel domain containing protein [Streptomyces sp. NBC_01477]
MTDTMWAYLATSGHRAGVDLSGYKVEATDGSIGRVDRHSDSVDSAYIVVDTGVWILGKHVMLPAGTITSVDTAKRRILVARSKDDIKNSPEFDRDKQADDAGYREQVGTYYGMSRS